MTAPAIAAEELQAGYDGGLVLQGLTLSVGRGDRLALIGRNGVGKTTFVNALAGAACIAGGRLLLGGRPAAQPRPWSPAQAGIAIVPQGRRIIAGLSVEENLRLGAAAGRSGRWCLDAVYRLFPILRERRRGSGAALSGGQQQMLAIGRALMANPSCLVLDEPSEGLAPVIVDQVAEVVAEVAADGTAILLIEQHLGLVLKAASRFAVLAQGRIAETGTLAGATGADLHHHVAV